MIDDFDNHDYNPTLAINTYTFRVEFKNVPIGQFFGTSVPSGQYLPLGQRLPVIPSVGLAELDVSVQ